MLDTLVLQAFFTISNMIEGCCLSSLMMHSWTVIAEPLRDIDSLSQPNKMNDINVIVIMVFIETHQLSINITF